YERSGKRIAIHSTEDCGLFCLLPEVGDFAAEAMRLATLNADPIELEKVFRWPGGEVLSYDILAEKGKWVMISTDEKSLERDHGRWPLMMGTVP
ncbi:MAG: hypothetical protein KDL87_13670, partial [Verrucomicrobiae bacterium]|nr:hypothetical protein [Verrucomicrobiae bacterium]